MNICAIFQGISVLIKRTHKVPCSYFNNIKEQFTTCTCKQSGSTDCLKTTLQ